MKFALAIVVFLAVLPTHSFAQSMSDLTDAAVRLKQAHVLRYYEKCISKNRPDTQCRAELRALHPRELAALSTIAKSIGSYDQHEVSRASSACYSPAHNYKDLVECWEQLATKMGAKREIGENSNGNLDSKKHDKIKSTFVKLGSFAKRSVFLCVRGKVDLNFEETVAHNFQKGGRDALWAMKVNSFESALLAKAAKAAQWPKMAEYYKAETANMTKVIRGEHDIGAYKVVMKRNEKLLKVALAPEMANKSVHSKNFKKFHSVCERVAATVIGRAKVLSSR